jgi:deoxyribonucleoside regulator
MGPFPATRLARGGDTKAMVRVAQLYYGMHLTQDAIGRRLGMSRFKVGRLLDRAVRDGIVRIEIVHPDARLDDLEQALVDRFGLLEVVVADVPTASGALDDEVSRTAVAAAAAGHLSAVRPAGIIGVSWGRTMLAVARALEPGWTEATEIVQLNGATSRTAHPTRATDIVDRFATASGASSRLIPAPAIVGSAELRVALERDPSVRDTLDAARLASTAVFSLGVLGPESVLVESGFVTPVDLERLRTAGAVGDVLGRYLTIDGQLALPELDERTVGLPLDSLRDKERSMGVAAGAGRGPIALAALRRGLLTALVTDEATADWLVRHG